jgi:hypothetical protein
MQGPFRAMMLVMTVFMVVFALTFIGVFGWIIRRLTSEEIVREFTTMTASSPAPPAG